jgi:hypothetical protein
MTHTGGLTQAQYQYLLSRIKASRIGRVQGNSHLEAWDVRRHLTRIFGFTGWSDEIIECGLVREIENPPGSITYSNGGSNNRTVWTVVYRVQMRLIVFDTHGRELSRWEDGACGDAVNQPSLGDAHDLAMKTALSQALKRCAVNLGDQFGLGLYNNGATDPVINQTLAVPEDEPVTAAHLEAASAADAPVTPQPSNDPTADPQPVPDQSMDQPEGAVRQAHSSASNTADRPGSLTESIAAAQRRHIMGLWTRLGYDNSEAKRAERIRITSRIVGRQVESTNDLSYAEATALIEALTQRWNLQNHQKTPATTAA